MSSLRALPGSAQRWPGPPLRRDVVLEGGLLHVVHDDTTPHEARMQDLLFVADVLESAGVGLVLVRRDGSVPVLVADLEALVTAERALVAAGAAEPLHVARKGVPPTLMREAPPLTAVPTALRLFRPRVTASGTLRYGAEHAAHLEFWRFGADRVEAPRANALMRRSTPRADVTWTTVERFGRSWRTVPGMFDTQPWEFTAEVDIVFSWVDGSASDFQRERAGRMAEYVVGEGDDGPARYRHVDELKYALRSVHMHAPWIRRIFVATDSPAPDWLADHPRVTIVRSEEFFADPSALPTHNSHAVESQLHRIPGLAEHFLYSNDDMFFGRPVQPELFFGPTGISKFVECDVRIGAGEAERGRSGHDNALRVNRRLLGERFGRTIVRDLEHCATPLRKSVLAELEAEFPEDFARTAASRFRAADDISVTNSLYHYYAMLTGRAITTTQPRVRYVQTTLVKGLRLMDRLVARTGIDMFCLNDGGDTEVPEEFRVEAIRTALEAMFPIPAPWEVEAVSRARGAARSARSLESA